MAASLLAPGEREAQTRDLMLYRHYSLLNDTSPNIIRRQHHLQWTGQHQMRMAIVVLVNPDVI